MSDEWMSAREALGLVSSIMPAEAAAEAISGRAHDGYIRSRASWFVEGETRRADCELPSKFWRDRGMYPLFQRWPTGDFEARIDHTHWRAYGVEFYGPDIEAIIPKQPPAAADPQISVGRKRSDEWAAWVAELAFYIHEQGYPDGVGSQGQQELIKAIDARLAGRGHQGLRRSTVRPVVQAVLDRHRSTDET